MFEDATFDARGAVRNDAPRWMMLTAATNAAVVAGLIITPLLYSHSLPGGLMAPRALYAPPVERVPAPEQAAESLSRTVIALPMTNIDRQIVSRPSGADPEPNTGLWEPTSNPLVSGSSVGGPSDLSAFHNGQSHVAVETETPSMARVSSGVVEGLLLAHVTPAYPQIAQAAHVEGDVVLGAVISTEGRVERLHVVSGPPLLREAAIGAVKDWRYKPYLLNGKAVEVETTITVRFSLHGR
ncbi:MAG TPA: energy transducer TonB [Acidobacteriaceae bacterium]